MSLEKDFWSHLGIEIGTFRTKCRAVADPGEAPPHPTPPLLLLLHQTQSKSINQLYLNTVNGSASWFSDMPCDNYNL